MRLRHDAWGQALESRPLLKRAHPDLRPSLIAFFARRVGNISEAEDLAQDVYLRLASTPDQQLRDRNAYVFQIAANLLRDRARRTSVRTRYVAGVQQEDTQHIDPLDPHRVASGREGLSVLVAALDELPERTRRIFLLYRYEQVDRTTIAETFGISISAVEKHLAKALAILTVKMGGVR